MADKCKNACGIYHMHNRQDLTCDLPTCTRAIHGDYAHGGCQSVYGSFCDRHCPSRRAKKLCGIDESTITDAEKKKILDRTAKYVRKTDENSETSNFSFVSMHASKQKEENKARIRSPRRNA